MNVMGKSFFVHESSFVDEGAIIGDNTKIWHFCHIQDGAVIGSNCNLGQNIYVGRGAVVGDGCKLQNNVSIYNGVTLGNGVFCGPSCVFTNDLTPRAEFPKGEECHVSTWIGDGASIGANVTIVCGYRIGCHSMIGAGAVVSCDVKDYALMLGVPARFVGWVCKCGTRLDDTLLCKTCERRYMENDRGLVCISDLDLT